MHAFRDVDYDRYTVTKEYDSDAETRRQHDMIERAAALVSERTKTTGKVITACVVTFGISVPVVPSRC